MSFRNDIRDHALGFDGAWLDHAWDMEGDVYKTAGRKIFAICAGSDAAASVTVKLTPGEASEALTLAFVKPAVWPQKWVTATITSAPERDIALEWLARSYQLVAPDARAPRRR